MAAELVVQLSGRIIIPGAKCTSIPANRRRARKQRAIAQWVLCVDYNTVVKTVSPYSDAARSNVWPKCRWHMKLKWVSIYD